MVAYLLISIEVHIKVQGRASPAGTSFPILFDSKKIREFQRHIS